MSGNRLVLDPNNSKKRCCYKCEKRTVGCHVTCEDYINEQNERKEYYEKLRKERELDLIDSERSINKRCYFRKTGCRR